MQPNSDKQVTDDAPAIHAPEIYISNLCNGVGVHSHSCAPIPLPAIRSGFPSSQDRIIWLRRTLKMQIDVTCHHRTAAKSLAATASNRGSERKACILKLTEILRCWDAITPPDTAMVLILMDKI